MQFDLFTFLASLFNFVVLLVLLRIFLFKRVTRAMDEREEKIASRWDEAEEAKAEAKQNKEQYDASLQDIEAEKRRILSDAKEQAEKKKQDDLETARQEVEEKRGEWLKSLDQDKEELARTLEKDVAEATVGAVRAILEDLADADLLELIVRQFETRIEDAPEEVSEAFEGENLTVSAGETLTDSQKSRIESALSKFQPESVRFAETDDELICGIEVSGGGSKLRWSVEDRVESIEELLSGALAGAAS